MWIGLTDCCDLTHLHSCLWNVLAAGFVDLPLVIPFLPDVGDGAETDAEADAQERDADTNGVEVVALSEYQSECGVEKEAQTIKVAVVQGGKHDDGLGCQEPEGSRKRDRKQLLHTSLLQMIGDVDVSRIVDLAGSLCALSEKDAMARLAAEEQGCGHDGPEASADAEKSPENVAPAPGLGDERHEEESGRRPARSCP